MDIQLAGESEQAIGTIISVFLPALVILVSLAVTALAGAGAWASARKMAGQVRPLVDEPDDWLVLGVGGIGEFVLHRTLDEALISRLLTAVCDAIAGQREVAKGIELGDAAK